MEDKPKAVLGTSHDETGEGKKRKSRCGAFCCCFWCSKKTPSEIPIELADRESKALTSTPQTSVTTTEINVVNSIQETMVYVDDGDGTGLHPYETIDVVTPTLWKNEKESH